MLDVKHAICFNIRMDCPGMDHCGSRSHSLLPRARVGFSPYLQHIDPSRGLGLARMVTRNFMRVPTLLDLQLIFFKNVGWLILVLGG